MPNITDENRLEARRDSMEQVQGNDYTATGGGQKTPAGNTALRAEKAKYDHSRPVAPAGNPPIGNPTDLNNAFNAATTPSAGGAAPATGTASATPGASTAPGNAAAASTTQRITNSVDLSDKIAEADKAWADAMQTSQPTIDAAGQRLNEILTGLQNDARPGEAGRVGRVDSTERENLLQQIADAQKQQSESSINYAVQQGVNDLQRAQEDAQPMYQTQRNQIAANEAQALDNQALYAEARGDRGGIGQAQYASIQNTAATNQLTVNREQTKLATDTARQIADLRAKGEFQKADELLKITQSYLSELMQLKQWADATNVSIDEFNIGVDQWEQEYNNQIRQALAGMEMDTEKYLAGMNVENQRYMNQAEVDRITGILSAYQQNAANRASTEMTAANLTGAFSDATPTAEAAAADSKRQAAAAEQMIASGITPTASQLAAIGWTQEQYNAYKAAADMAKQAASGGGGRNSLYRQIQTLIKGNVKNSIITEYMNNHINSADYDASDVERTRALWRDAQENAYRGQVEYDYNG